MKDFRVQAIANSHYYDVEVSSINPGDVVVGYLNSWHKYDDWSVQVEIGDESGAGLPARCSGIIVIDVLVKEKSIKKV